MTSVVIPWTGLMRVVLWTLQDKREQRPASCMLYLATVGYNLHTKTAQVEALHSLGQSRLPPHAVGPFYIAMISSCQGYAGRV